jgi:hypothetical protein
LPTQSDQAHPLPQRAIPRRSAAHPLPQPGAPPAAARRTPCRSPAHPLPHRGNPEALSAFGLPREDTGGYGGSSPREAGL